jgi:hypothetical protein
VEEPPRYSLEFYADASGDEPVLRWLREELTAVQRRAIGVALREVLEVEGVGVCRTGYGKQLGDGLFEFRLRHDAAEILRSVGGSLSSPVRRFAVEFSERRPPSCRRAC